MDLWPPPWTTTLHGAKALAYAAAVSHAALALLAKYPIRLIPSNVNPGYTPAVPTSFCSGQIDSSATHRRQ